MQPEPIDDEHELISAMDAAHGRAMRAERQLFELITEADRLKIWQDSGAKNLAHWLCMRYGISTWKAHRWIASAHALGGLPAISDAFAWGELGIDKVVELTRFATPETEERLVRWANTVSGARIRKRAELAERPRLEDEQQLGRERFLTIDYATDPSRFYLEACGPAEVGAKIMRAIERVAASVPEIPGAIDRIGARQFDALAAICSARIAADADPDRASVMVHVPYEVLTGDRPVSGWNRSPGCEIDCGPAIHVETARRLSCDALLQVVLEDENGVPLRLGRATRQPSRAMRRLLRRRDPECRFPECGARRFLQAHHIRPWSEGGETNLENLARICTFHHWLAHEGGWKMRMQPDGTIRWYTPEGRLYRPGPALPRGPSDSPRGSDPRMRPNPSPDLQAVEIALDVDVGRRRERDFDLLDPVGV